jgi:hypothetical protein
MHGQHTRPVRAADGHIMAVFGYLRAGETTKVLG